MGGAIHAWIIGRREVLEVGWLGARGINNVLH